MAAVTNAQILAAITALGARVDALEAPAPAPVKAAPAKGKVSAAFGGRTFDAYVADRRASAIPCEIHPAEMCNRAFSPRSSGREGHVAKIVTTG